MKTTREPNQPKATNIIRLSSYKRGPSSVHSESSTSSLRKPKVSVTNIVEKSGFSVYTPAKKQNGFSNRPNVEIYKPSNMPKMAKSFTIPDNRPLLASRSVLGPINMPNNNGHTSFANNMIKVTASNKPGQPGKTLWYEEDKIYKKKEDEEDEKDEEKEKEKEKEDEEDIDLSDSTEEPEVNEARTNRKIEDLELSLKSLLVVNAMLEETVKKQTQQILHLKKQPNGALPDQMDLILEHTQQYTFKEANADDCDDKDDEDDSSDEWRNDELFQRVHRVTSEMIEQGEKCVEFEYQILGKVLPDYSLDGEE